MQSKEPVAQEGEISVKELVQKIIGTARYLRSRWVKILLTGVTGAIIGLAYAYLQPVKYTSRLTFVVEETKSSAGGLASLAGQFGLDLGGGGGGGIFNGDNILLFLKSENLVRETLLTSYLKEPKTLGDKYAQAYKLHEKWNKSSKIGNIDFYGGQLNRIEDSLLQAITDQIIKKELSVSRPDKKASFVEVTTSMNDEVLSKLFCDKLVSLALQRYVVSKTKTKEANVVKLQKRADSLEAILNVRTYTSAASQQSLLDINPGLRAASAPTEIKTRDKMTAAAIYTEVVKNLELSKTILNQETPTIEIVDQSSLPLKKEKVSKIGATVLMFLVSSFLACFILLTRRQLKLMTT
jgi:LPS O-antigen subunit length determinant protein (WzzB/FepE family)